MVSRATRRPTTRLVVDFGDRVGRDEAAVAREETGADRECVRYVRERSVHRALDLADHATPVVGDEKTGCVDEIQRESGHVRTYSPSARKIPCTR